MVYQDREQLMYQIMSHRLINHSNYTRYTKWVDELINNGLFDFYKEYELDIFSSIFIPIIQVSQSNATQEVTEERIRNIINRALEDKKRRQNLANSITKEEVLKVIDGLYEMAGKVYQLRNEMPENELMDVLHLDRSLDNSNELVIPQSLCSELCMKILYMLKDENLGEAITESRKAVVKNGNGNIPNIVNRIYNDLMKKIKHENDIYNHPESNSSEEELIRNLQRYNNQSRVSGHHLYALLNNVNESDRVLIKHLLITMQERGYFKEKRLPTTEEIIDGNDYLLLIKDYNPEDLLKTINAETADHSNDNVEARYLETLRELEDNYHLALATATLIVTRYRRDEINHKIKKDEELFSEEEQRVINTLSKEEQDFIRFIKEHLKDSSLVNIGDNEILNRIKKYVNIIKTTTDIDALNVTFQLWINSIKLEELTNDQFETLMKIDKRFIYDRLPLQSKVMMKRRESYNEEIIQGHTKVKIEDAFGKDKILKAEVYDSKVDALAFQSLFSNRSVDRLSLPNGIIKLNPHELTPFSSAKSYKNRKTLFHIKAVGKIREMSKEAINLRSQTPTELFAEKINEIEINSLMDPLTIEEAYYNYCVCKHYADEKGFDLSLIMYKSPFETKCIESYCEKRNIKFYPELLCWRKIIVTPNEDDYEFEKFAERVRTYKQVHPHIKLSPNTLREYFFRDDKFKEFLEQEDSNKLTTDAQDLFNSLSLEEKKKVLEFMNNLQRDKELSKMIPEFEVTEESVIKKD